MGQLEVATQLELPHDVLVDQVEVYEVQQSLDTVEATDSTLISLLQ
jgi:hypothetical protein